MRDDKGSNHRKSETGINTAIKEMQDCTAAQRKTMRDELHILARIIARAHLRRQAERSATAAPGPPPMGRHEERATPEIGGSERHTRRPQAGRAGATIFRPSRTTNPARRAPMFHKEHFQ